MIRGSPQPGQNGGRLRLEMRIHCHETSHAAPLERCLGRRSRKASAPGEERWGIGTQIILDVTCVRSDEKIPERVEIMGNKSGSSGALRQRSTGDRWRVIAIGHDWW
ncbi:hypothetical protein BBP40_005620 [Aspergillus hancockii]|nr:hypothetical protein BBP40_005620 [Aspergillus hancockii]